MSIDSFFIILILMVAFGIAIWIVILETKRKEPPMDSPFIECYFSHQYTNGRNKGVLKDYKEFSDRVLVTYIATDRNYLKEYNEGSIKDEVVVKVWVEKNKIVPIHKSAKSKDREEMWLLPPTTDDLPEGLKKTFLGKEIMKMVEDLNNNRIESEILMESKKSVVAMAKKLNGGELSVDYLDMREAKEKDILKMLTDPKSQNKTFSYDPNRTGGN